MAHGHEHRHAHDHGPDCACGCCEHERAHEREHDHGHDCAHAEVFEQEWGSVELEAHTHEQAATVSMDIRLEDGVSMVFADLVGIMQSIAEAAENAGGIVGHIKGFARQGNAFAHASVASADLAPTCEGDQSLAFGSGATIQLVAIVLLIEQTELLGICKSALP